MATLGYPKQDMGNPPTTPIPVATQGQSPIPGLPGQQPGQGQVISGGKPSASPAPVIRRRMIPIPQGAKK
jgi:hypothetical protein